MEWIIALIYCFFLSFILLYSLSQISLCFSYRRSLKLEKAPIPNQPENWPRVTVQLPIFNEKYVIERLIDAIIAFDYPKDKLQIQILDDSNDETPKIVSQKVAALKKEGFNIDHIQRENQKDFKAGALQYGLKAASGDFIAVFDADFLPIPEFLKRTLPHFQHAEIGLVQSRWGHLNADYSLLTRLQSYALNAHFTVEQMGRAYGNHFINFNGTAGIWRKQCIEDAGGWEGDTLTEDLDLSYRAQLKGWKFVYLDNLVSPAEIPVEINSLKSQQFRWAKGAAECSRKNLGKVFQASHLTFSTKWNAFFHLMNSFTWVCLYASSILLLPFISIVDSHPELSHFWTFYSIFHISFILLFLFYLQANADSALKGFRAFVVFLLQFPAFLALSIGISLYNAIGVMEGYLGKKSSFIRTPKLNILDKKDSIAGKGYVGYQWKWINVLELLSFLYFLYGIHVAISMKVFTALPFMFLMSFGMGFVLVGSWYYARKARYAKPAS